MNPNNIIHEEDAKAMICPIARVSGLPKIPSKCRGSACMLWRWQELMTSSPGYKEALKKLGEENGEKPPYAKAARMIADHPEHYGQTVERGWCGLGGTP